MKPFELLGEARSPDGTAIKLTRRDDEYFILADGLVLMSSLTHGSEDAIATYGCRHARTLPRPNVLIGGLGMGFTLRAALDVLPHDATVVVAELVPAIEEWNRGPLGPLAGNPLKDQRVSVASGDVAALLKSSINEFDAVILDVDNGPAAITAEKNAALYTVEGISIARSALKVGGALVIWAIKEDPKFTQRLRKGGFEVHVHPTRARLKKGGPRHVIYVGHKTAKVNEQSRFQN